MATIFLSLSGFASVKTFPIAMSIIGLHGCMMIYGIGCVVGAVFVLVVLKETKGKSLDGVDIKIKDEIDPNNKVGQPLISKEKV